MGKQRGIQKRIERTPGIHGLAVDGELVSRRHQREARFAVIRNAIAVAVNERAGIEVILPPVSPDFSHIAGRPIGARSMAEACVGAAAHADRGRNPVDDLVVPLVEDGYSPITSWNLRQSERPVVLALREREISAIRTTQAGVALGIAKGIARTAAVQSLVRRPAHACARDHSGNGLAAIRMAGAAAERQSFIIDDLWIGKANRDVE